MIEEISVTVTIIAYGRVHIVYTFGGFERFFSLFLEVLRFAQMESELFDKSNKRESVPCTSHSRGVDYTAAAVFLRFLREEIAAKMPAPAMADSTLVIASVP